MLERQRAWDALATIDLPEAKERINQGVEQYVSGGLAPDIWLNVLEAAQERLDPATRQKLEEFQRQKRATDELEGYREAAFGGDVAAGKELFFNRTELSCVRCHQVGNVGGEVGPNLTEIGKAKDNRYLLESIVQPDAKIAENFESVVLLTEDDQVITGILRKETPSLIELIDANGNLIKVDPVEVVARRKGQSAMPADLLKSLSRRELRDLVAYLSSLKGSE
jgi:quinoprotein glucose dehydrogenase